MEGIVAAAVAPTGAVEGEVGGDSAAAADEGGVDELLRKLEDRELATKLRAKWAAEMEAVVGRAGRFGPFEDLHDVDGTSRTARTVDDDTVYGVEDTGIYGD